MSQLPGPLRRRSARRFVNRQQSWFTRAEVRRYRSGRATLGGRLAGDCPVLLLTTTGRRTGQSRVTPLLYHCDDEARLLTVAANGGADWNPHWYSNLVTNPEAQVEIDGRRIPVIAVPVADEERDRLWPLAEEAFSTLAAAQRGTDRPIPLLHLYPRQQLSLRQGVRALVVDDDRRVLLVRFEFPEHFTQDTLWATPGGGVEHSESHHDALRRELHEEVGLTDPTIGPLLWTRTHVLPMSTGHDGQHERVYLVRTPPFDPAPLLSPELLRAEFVTELRWWSLDELRAGSELFAPRGLVPLVESLFSEGPPRAPIDAGV